MKSEQVATWKKRIESAKKKVKEKWERDNEVETCYNYWKGDQLVDNLDELGNKKQIINKIHPEVKNSMPSLYFYKPVAKFKVQPEQEDDPGSQIEECTQLLEDTANHLISDPDTRFMSSTQLALKEAFWACGVVEVVYSADFADAPNATKPAQKDTEDESDKAPAGVEPADAEQPPAPPAAPPDLTGMMGGGPPDVGMGAPNMGMDPAMADAARSGRDRCRTAGTSAGNAYTASREAPCRGPPRTRT